MPRVRVTEEQLLQALRDLGAVSSDTAVTTRKVALHLGERTSYVRDRLGQMYYSAGSFSWGKPRDPAIVGHRPEPNWGGPNYWWAIEAAA